MFTRVQWASDLCRQAGNTSPSPSLLAFIVGWSTFETNTNSGAKNNLLNTTLSGIEGSTNFNSAGVKNFPTYQSGISATLTTLRNGFYPRIIEGIENDENIFTDSPDIEILHELHKWSGDENGYGEGLVTLGASHLLDHFDYATSPYAAIPNSFRVPEQIQIDVANDRWKALVPDIPMGTGIYKSWLNEWVSNLRQFGPPTGTEKSSKNWQGKPIVYQIFVHGTCEWDGSPHWFDGRGPIE